MNGFANPLGKVYASSHVDRQTVATRYTAGALGDDRSATLVQLALLVKL